MAESTVKDWLERSTKVLEAVKVPSARLDALILLEDATGKDRAWLLAHPGQLLSELCERTVLSHTQILLERRVNHEPMAYIRGKSEFYGREFKVTPATLQPRPETETMISLLRKLIMGGGFRSEGGVADIGTGSGCLAITAKLEWPELKVYATDISNDALKVANENARNLGAEVKFYQGNLLEPFSKLQSPVSNLFAILANLPYVPDGHTINKAAMQEPKIAIFGGEDGLDFYREMFDQLRTSHSALRPKFIFTESLPFQHLYLQKIAADYGYKLSQAEDFIQIFSR